MMDEETQNQQEEHKTEEHKEQTVTKLSGLYEDWFLDYASYVILERAVPDLRDGLKPVQRRILHSMKEMDDGRYNKVANIIGNTMKYHPHGDRSIGDALIQLGQKDMLIDMQGNWGNILTGDPAAAPRYIEARLSKFALEVVFNPKTTNWLLSYDGRNKEPEVLPVKFPLLLAQGVEGIAVGLASKILPHNFVELIDASISYLRGRSFELYPDFPTGGMADVSRYNEGLRGGKVRVRAKILKQDNKTLIINELPYSMTTSSLIDSIIAANDKGKIKIKKIEDNTSENVEIKIVLGSGVSPDQTIDALYAFTACELSLSPNSCVIDEDKPAFLSVKDILKNSTDHTLALLKKELEIKRGELMEQWHFASLEKIFIRERIYRDIEEAENWEQVIELIDKGLEPFKTLFHREITRDDIVRLTEIKIKRISKYNEFKADELIAGIEEQIKEMEYHLAHLVDYAVDYYKNIKKKYGAGRERKTELRSFENIDAASVAVSNVKLYINREEGFIGKALRRDELLFECSDIDDVIVFRDNGTFQVTRVDDKVFVGKGVIHVGVFNKNDDRTIYNLIYRDGKTGPWYAKRFAVTSITRDKVYPLTKGQPGSKIVYFSANPNGEAEVVKVKLRQKAKLRKLSFEYDFSTLAVKGRSARGNLVSKHYVSSVSLKEEGVSTLGARDIWYDETVQRLNVDGRGTFLGSFHPEDKILTIMQSGEYLITGFDLTTHFEEDMIKIGKYNPETVWAMVHYDGKSKYYYLKRFKIEPGSKKVSLLTDHPKSRMVHITSYEDSSLELLYHPKDKPKNKDSELILIDDFIDVKGQKARGKRLTGYGLKRVKLIENIPEDTEQTAPEAKGPEVPDAEALSADNQPSTTKVQQPADEVRAAEQGRRKKPVEQSGKEDADEQKSPQAKPMEKQPASPAPPVKSKKTKPAASLPTLPLPEEDAEAPAVASPKEEKPKKARRKSTKAPKKQTEQKKKVSLDSDEPLQMELDF